MAFHPGKEDYLQVPENKTHNIWPKTMWGRAQIT